MERVIYVRPRQESKEREANHGDRRPEPDRGNQALGKVQERGSSGGSYPDRGRAPLQTQRMGESSRAPPQRAERSSGRGGPATGGPSGRWASQRTRPDPSEPSRRP